MEMQGIDPRTSHMLSERSTIWATSPCYAKLTDLSFLFKKVLQVKEVLKIAFQGQMKGELKIAKIKPQTTRLTQWKTSPVLVFTFFEEYDTDMQS